MDTARPPKQARSRARADAILDAADAVFLEMGFAAATTNHVAARAGTSIGSLYRFFENKDALLRGLAERYAQRMAALGAELTRPEDAARPLARRVAEGVYGFAAFLQANPGFLTLLREAGHPALREGRAAHEAGMTALIAGSLAHRGLPPEEVEAVAATLNAALSAVQGLAATLPAERAARVLDETVRMVTAYLQARLPPEAPPPAPSPGAPMDPHPTDVLHHGELQAALTEAFLEFDADGDGRISAAELREAMARLDEHLTPVEAEALVQRHDTDGDGSLELGEFLAAFEARR